MQWNLQIIMYLEVDAHKVQTNRRAGRIVLTLVPSSLASPAIQ